MNSNRFIEVDKSRCGFCREVFYEFRDYELDQCPHCLSVLSGTMSCDVEETLEIEVEVDYKTGKLLLV
jgi:hypothetical protein